MEYLSIGRIVNTHGIKGEVKVNGQSECFDKNFKHPLYIKGETYLEVHVENARVQKEQTILKFKEYDDINQVLAFKGLEIYAKKKDLAPLREGEFYIEDLIGLEVYNEQGEFRGKVKEVRNYPQCFYFVVDYQKKHYLIPFLPNFVVEITDRIILKEMEGLIP